MDLLVDDDAFDRHADLALMHEGAEIGGLGGTVEIGVVADDQRVLAAEFEAAFFQMRAGLGRDLAAYRRRTGK